MQKVILRDFQRKLHSYLKKGGSYMVVSGEGKPLGLFTVGTSFARPYSEADKVDDGQAPESELCAKCEANPIQYQGSYWSNGEEIPLKICGICYKKYRPSGFKRIL